MTFEWMVARRYLAGGRGARRDRFLGAITLIAVLAVAAGVTALVLALSINAGFRETYEEQLLGATAHVTLARKVAGGIRDYDALAARLRKLEGVTSVSPVLYQTVLISHANRARGIILKGIRPQKAPEQEKLFIHLREGSSTLAQPEQGASPLIIGTKLAQNLGVFAGDIITNPLKDAETVFADASGSFQIQVGTNRPTTITLQAGINDTLNKLAAHINRLKIGVSASVITDANGARLSLTSQTSGEGDELTVTNDADDPINGLTFSETVAGTNASFTAVLITSPQGHLTPFGVLPRYRSFKVEGVFESGYWYFDDGLAFTRLDVAQELFGWGDRVSLLELRLADVRAAEEVSRAAERAAGRDFVATPWMETYKSLFRALQVEKLLTAIFIGLIVFVAGLNILILLVMLVLEKRRDIAVLLSLGARTAQIQRIFILHGVAIGALGTLLGLGLGYAVAVLGARFQLFPLEPQIYGIDHVPFRTELLDGFLVVALALAISLTATIYPARRATRGHPIDALRYE
ncbi:MAG: FtsX-like permease family protein [Terriglobia bacterium]